MSAAYGTAPSKLVWLDDPYEAFCLDEAICDYTARLRGGQALRPAKSPDNRALIEAMEGGASHGGRRIGRGQP
jgi:hypothetical protein